MQHLVAANRVLDQGTLRHLQLESIGLDQVAAGNPLALASDDVQAFVSLYERHIAREEAELLPMAKRLLSDADLDHIGLAMRERRGPAAVRSESRPPG